jgi:hypothetical protein
MFKTVIRSNRPISAGISPEIRFPIKSRILKNGKDVMQAGIGPEIPFQSEIVRLESLSSLQIEGEIEPVMYPDRPAFWKMGSSDSPRRLMSATLLVSMSQLTPYQLWQQSVPVQELKMPK